MDVLENILERISQTQEQRDAYLRQAEAEEQKIGKLESMYYLLEDPATQELMQDVVVGLAVQNGVAPPNGNSGAAGEKHYVGMQRVREYVAAMAAGHQFTVHDVFTKSIEHTPSEPEAPAPGVREAAQGQHQPRALLDGQGRRSRSGEAGARAREHRVPEAGGQVVMGIFKCSHSWGFPQRWPEFDGKRNVDVQTCSKCGARRESPVQFGKLAPPKGRTSRRSRSSRRSAHETAAGP